MAIWQRALPHTFLKDFFQISPDTCLEDQDILAALISTLKLKHCVLILQRSKELPERVCPLIYRALDCLQIPLCAMPSFRTGA